MHADGRPMMPICKIFSLKRTCLLLLILCICPVLPLEYDLDLEHSHDVLDDDGDGVVEDVSARFVDGLDYTGVGSIDIVATAKDANHSFIDRGTMPFLSREIFRKAFSRALGGGITGAIAGIIQVLSLMWLRTVTNYQYRYGTSFIQALTALYGMGGIPRLYSGVSFALIQAPLSRFVSTAANDGIGTLLEKYDLGPGREVLVAAVVVGLFRMMLMPIDTCKTVLQIEHKKGLADLMSRVRRGNIHLLYSGSLANAASSFLGHYPWFYTYNLLSRNAALIRLLPWMTVRNALIGFISSIISDTVANFMRVIKTSKQALGSTRSNISYAETISMILAVDGWGGLFGRGLKTRILGNALQSILFTVIWRSLSERWKHVDVETELSEASPEDVRVDYDDEGDNSETDEYDLER